MAKLGKFEYPEFTLSETIDLGQRIAREFAGEVSRHGLASAMEMSESGGAFAARVGALRMWVVAVGRSNIRVTRDGLRACSPVNPEDAEEARRALAGNVQLFVEISKRSAGQALDAARMALMVEEVTGADHGTVRKQLTRLDRVYSDVCKVLSGPKGEGSASQQSTVSDPQELSKAQAGAVHSENRRSDGDDGPAPARAIANGRERAQIELRLPDGVIALPETTANLDAMLTVLWAHRQIVAARLAAAGVPTNANPPDFVLRASRTGQGATA